MAKEVFKFDLEDKVVFEDAIEIKGTIIGRAELLNAGPQYKIRYMDGTGSPTEAWWDEDALMADEDSGGGSNDNDREDDRRRRDDD